MYPIRLYIVLITDSNILFCFAPMSEYCYRAFGEACRSPADSARCPADSAQPLLFLSHSLSGGTEKAAPFIWDAAGQHQKLYSLSRHVSHVRERCSLRFSLRSVFILSLPYLLPTNPFAAAKSLTKTAFCEKAGEMPLGSPYKSRGVFCLFV